MEAIETLKKMIRSWLDDTYPEMPGEKRQRMAQNMDVSLIEVKKEESMKTFYEINNVVRMSFIEMQYMKKVSLRDKFFEIDNKNPPISSHLLRCFIAGNDERTACA